MISINVSTLTEADIEQLGFDKCIQILRDNNIQTSENYLPYIAKENSHVYYDDIPSTYEYYRRFINDVLRNIRNGNVDYVFRLYQIQELLRFEPDLHIDYDDGIFIVSLNPKCPISNNAKANNPITQ